MDPLTQKIEDQIKTLPSVTQRALHDFDWKTQILSIGKLYDLNLDQLDTLEQETTLVLVGLVPAGNYVSELKKRLEISTTAASQIVEDANKKIFLPLRDLVLQYGEEDNEQHQTLRDAGIHIGDDDEDTFTDSNKEAISEQPEQKKINPSPIEKQPESEPEIPPMPIKNNVEQKISGTHQTGQVISNHSLDAKEIPPMPKKPVPEGHDPYREPIE